MAASENVNETFVDVLSQSDLAVLHLACHCHSGKSVQSVSSPELLISWQTAEARINLFDLKIALYEPPLGFRMEPLVFLNACNTMTSPLRLIHGSSFPTEFLKFGASGVIATACDVPDQFAAEFAAKFYENLLVKDATGCSPTLSQALLMTRRFFINPPYFNPLGLAYGLFASPDLRVVWKLAELE